MDAPYDDVFDAIKQLIDSVWDSGIAVIVYENETDTAPSGEPAPWVHVVLESHLYGQQSIGGGLEEGQNRWDEDGSLWLHVFVPRGTGTREARRIAKAMANLFRGRLMLDDALEFGDADMSAGDPGKENGNYYLLSVNLDWRRTEAQ